MHIIFNIGFYIQQQYTDTQIKALWEADNDHSMCMDVLRDQQYRRKKGNCTIIRVVLYTLIL